MSTDPTAEQQRAATPDADASAAAGVAGPVGSGVAAGAGSGVAAGAGTPPAAVAHCASCGVQLASDQRYCLECGERRMPMSSFLLSSTTPPAPGASPAGPPAPPLPPAPASSSGADRRSSALSVIAFVGVLLLAMGVGVLIGRAGNSKSSSSAPQVITVDAGGSGGGGSSEAAFASSWPAGKSGYTVQLQTLPVSGTAVSAVESAKSSATAKGAKNVGALKSEEFSSLPSGNYVIYCGDYAKRAEAQKALSSLKKSFPAASVIHVAESSGSSSSSSSAHESEGSEKSQASGAKGSSPTNPAPASVLKNLDKSSGKKYEEESNNLPDVVETGK